MIFEILPLELTYYINDHLDNINNNNLCRSCSDRMYYCLNKPGRKIKTDKCLFRSCSILHNVSKDCGIVMEQTSRNYHLKVVQCQNYYIHIKLKYIF